MRRILACALMTMLPAGCSPADPPSPRLTYPAAATGAVVDDYAGTKVPDPYRWMESLDSNEVAGWVAASNAVTEAYLKALPLRQPFQTRLTALWNYPRVGVPYIVDTGALFYSRNSGLQRQAPVYRRASIAAEPSMVLDPNAISEDGSVSVGQWSPSPDGSLLAYGLAEGGADWRTVKVRNVATGQDLADEVRWMRFSDISWTQDSKGFFYSRYPEPPKNKVLEAALANHAVYYHRVGTRAVAGRADLRAQGPAGMDRQRRGVRGRPLPVRPDVRGRRQQEPSLLCRPRSPDVATGERTGACRSKSRATPNTCRSAPSAPRCSCAPTRTRPTARCSPPCWARRARRSGRRSCRSGRRRSRASRSSAAA